LFFKPSRNSVTRREESHASAVDRTVEPIAPVERGAEAMIADGVAFGAATSLSMIFVDPVVVDFLRTIASVSYRLALTISEQKIRIMTYLGTSIDFIDGV
jgi:hypothetical protein